ncbi:MAG: GNAT family N-acetyltransferase [Clostridium sp.]|nr:GNAT family N-acetyltransferase [Clostridium sp.]
MVKIFETKQYDSSIVNLWKEAFGDTDEDIHFFLEHCKNKSCLCLKKNNELCSMLFLVDCSIDNAAFKYIYAACTAGSGRKNGYMTKLLEYCQSNFENIVLIPADDALVDYYRKRSFNHNMDIKNILFNESSEIKEYLLEGCNLEAPFALAYRKGE